MDWLGILTDGVLATIGPLTAAYALSAIGLNIQFGYGGLLNFGHVSFMMIGAYGTAITADAGGSLWVAILVGVALSILWGLLLGIPTLRLRADYLAITTIAAAEALRLVIRSSWAEPVTNGVFGIQGFADEFFDLNPFEAATLYGIDPFVVTGRKLWVMIVGWALVALATLFLRRIIRSPWGRALKAIREDEDAAASIGKNAFAFKLQALMLGGAMAALAGILLGIEQQNVTPDAYLPKVTFILYVIVILGGAATIFGPILGAIVFQFLFFTLDSLMAEAQANVGWVGDLLSPSDAAQVKLVLVGVGLMLLMVFRPQGLLGDREETLIDDQ